MGVMERRAVLRWLRKRWLPVTLAASVLVLVAVGGIVVLNIDGEAKPDTKGPEPCVESSEKTGVTEPENPPQNGGVEVVDKGVTTAEDLGNVSRHSSFAGVGTRLENTSSLAARDVEVTLTATWPDGEPVRMGQSEDPWNYGPWNIGSLRPGQKFGLGFIVHVLNDHETLEPELELKVDIAVAEWWQPDNDVHPFADITATMQKPSEPDVNIPNPPLNFTVNSGYCEAVGAARVAVLYRDVNGEIIGGATIHNVPPWRGGKDGVEEVPSYPPGKTSGMYINDLWTARTDVAEFSDVEADRSKTEIYPYVDSTADD